MNFNAKQIMAPKYWELFEDICLAVFCNIWSDAQAKKNGRSGQPQNGTDIYGRPNGGLSFHGVQCKGKDAGLGSKVTKTEFDAELKKAESFKPTLAHWTLASTAPKDSEMEKYVRVCSDERERAGKFGVDILFWEDLQSKIATQPAVIEQYYPDQSPRVIRLMDRLEGKVTTAAMATAHKATCEEIKLCGGQRASEDLIRLTIEDVNDPPRGVPHEEMAKALLVGDVIVLEAEPGAGKTTTLLQIATRLGEMSKVSIPLIVPLAEQLNRSATLARQIFDRPRLTGIGAETLNNMALAGHFTFLCDGWNERSFDERAWLQGEFGRLRREYPSCGLLVTTRLLSPLSIPQAQKFVIKPLTFSQQLSILRFHDAKTAEQRLLAARQKRGLRSIIRNPFYLSALSVIAPKGSLPATKEEILRELTTAHDQNPLHRDELHKVFQGNHVSYLRGLAAVMAQGGNNALREADAKICIRNVSDKLVAEGILETKSRPDLSAALESLVGHHLLVVLPSTGSERIFGFQHQQMLEWYASFWLEELILAAATGSSDAARQSAVEVLNRPDTDEIIFFAVERLGKTYHKATGSFILQAYELDITLAAELIERVPNKVWRTISEEVKKRVAILQKSHPDQAIRFMGRSGQPDFADQVWGAIQEEARYNALGGLNRGWLTPGVLGPNGIVRVSSLPSGIVRSIVWDFCLDGAEQAFEFAEAVALRTGLPEVALVVLQHLEFEGAEDQLDKFAAKLPDPLREAVARLSTLQDAKGQFREWVLSAKKEKVNKLSGAERYHALCELVAAGEDVDPSDFVNLALTVTFKDYHGAHRAIDFAATNFGNEFQIAALTKLKAGQELPVYAWDYLLPAPEDQEALFVAFEPQNKTGRLTSQIARTLTRDSVGKLLDQLQAISQELDHLRRDAPRALVEKRSAIVDAICSVSAVEVVQAIVLREPTTAAEVNDLSEVIFRLKTNALGSADKEGLPISPELKAALVEKLKGWASIVSTPGATRRWYASHYATALARIADPALLPSFMTALTYELREAIIDREELEELRRCKTPEETHKARRYADPNRDRTGYYMIFRNALNKFDGEETKDVLLSLLPDAIFGEAAAFELIRYGSSKPPANGFGPSPDFKLIVAARGAARESLSPVANAVLNRIQELLTTGTPQDAEAAVAFATAAVQMDFGERAEPILEAAERAPMPEGRYRLLAAMLVAGVEVPCAWIEAGYEAARDKYFGGKWQDPREWWVVRRWLELLGASDSPDAVQRHFELLPDEYRTHRYLQDVAHAIGFSPAAAKASSSLIAMANALPEFIGSYEWQKAIVRQGQEDSAAYLLTLLFGNAEQLAKGGNGYDTPRIVAEIFLKHPNVKAEFLSKIQTPGSTPTPLVCAVLGCCVLPDEVCALLPMAAANGGPMCRALVGAVSEFAVKKVLIEGSNSYEQQPDDLSELRKALFARTSAKGPQARLAYDMLMAIENRREEFGRPPNEPRHPDFASGKPWPMNQPEI